MIKYINLNHYKISILIIFLFSIQSCQQNYKTNKLASDKKLEQKFIELKKKSVQNNNPIIYALDTLTPYIWDTVIIVTPYISIKKIESKLAIYLTEIYSTNIE